ncbi:MAG: alcohol dehydrogenase catalytic domain-containing protein [Armatimonadetes bacterium]|nr:alcohol dehydrogenase catalytic domain-containing protein [Armatimonadota bacterium]
MRAAFFDGKAKVRLEEVPSPSPGPGEAVVRVLGCGVCGSDLHSFHNRWPQPPVTPGHEVMGVVETTGEGAAGLRPGDVVAVEPLVSCGECRWCRSGQESVCPQHEFLSWHRPGGFAEMMVAPARCLLPLPAGPAREQGFLVEPLAVGVHALRRAPLMGGNSVAVLGAGTIGLLAAAAARALGAGKVIITARHAHQADLAARLGADHVVSLGEGRPEEAIRELTGGDGADVVLDGAGTSQSIDTAIKSARRGGSVSLVGIYVMPPRAALSDVIGKELRLVGSNCYGCSGGRRDFSLAIDLLASGKVSAGPLVTHRRPLAAIQEAFETAADKSTGAVKVVVEPSLWQGASG